MAHKSLIPALFLAIAACGGAPPGDAAARKVKPARPTSWSSGAEAWGKYHSKRFQLSVPLPDGHAWKIDDHKGPALVATHPGTGSILTIQTTQEEDLMNRQRCEEHARKLGWVPAANLTTVDDHVITAPEAYDSRLWVALDPDHADTRVDGHVFLFGAFLRNCLFVHLATSVATVEDEDVLATRLAIASDRIVQAITLDPLRVTNDAAVPRDKPDVRR